MHALRSVGLVAVASALAATAGCGGGSSDGSDKPPVIIEITEDAGTITPNDGHAVDVEVGQEIQLNVSSDVDDEIHVHSDPEHEYEVQGGEDESYSFSIDSPGVYPIESHGLDITLVKLQVS
jgi:hypothetical protein